MKFIGLLLIKRNEQNVRTDSTSEILKLALLKERCAGKGVDSLIFRES